MSGRRRSNSATWAAVPWCAPKRHSRPRSRSGWWTSPTTNLTFITPLANFLTQVPQVLLLNPESGVSAQEVVGAAGSRNSAAPRLTACLAFPFSDAAEVAALSPEEQGIRSRPGPAGATNDLVTKACFDQLGLISFLTTGEDEVRARPIRRGLNAKKAGLAISTGYREARLPYVPKWWPTTPPGTRLPKARRDAGCAAPGRQGLHSPRRRHHRVPLQRVAEPRPNRHGRSCSSGRLRAAQQQGPCRHTRSTSPD